MRYLKLFGVALAAVCAIGAIMAASAFALPTLLPETAQEWTGESRGGTELIKIEGGREGRKVTCRSATALEGTVEAGKPLGLFHIHFKECEEEGLRVKCTGTGEETGVILSLGSWHIVYDTLKATLNEAGVAILFLPGKTVFKCSIVTVEVLLGGMVLCLILNPLALTKHFEFHCNRRTSGPPGPEETKYDNQTGTWIPIVGLLSNENGGTFVESIQLGLGLMLFTADQLIMV